MSRELDLTNKRYGKLIVVERIFKDKAGRHWRCVCDCGNEVEFAAQYLSKGTKTSCGCVPRKTRFIDLTGKRFGRLTVIKEFGKDDANRLRWLCKCDCGNEHITRGENLRSGKTNSCGCYRCDRVKDTLLIDLTGRRFGRLLVVELSEKRNREYYGKWDRDWETTITTTTISFSAS